MPFVKRPERGHGIGAFKIDFEIVFVVFHGYALFGEALNYTMSRGKVRIRGRKFFPPDIVLVHYGRQILGIRMERAKHGRGREKEGQQALIQGEIRAWVFRQKAGFSNCAWLSSTKSVMNKGNRTN
jgi:hypothetical protein